MAIIIGGHEAGILDTSLPILNRGDRTRATGPGGGEQIYINVANGNLSIQKRDIFMPSQGQDFDLVRTYNSRPVSAYEVRLEDARWPRTHNIFLNVRYFGGEKVWEVTYSDGTVMDFRYDEDEDIYVSTDGAGAYETLVDLGVNGGDASVPTHIVTRADQSTLTFNKHGLLLKWEDTNGVKIEYEYDAERLIKVIDDDGHVFNYIYGNGNNLDRIEHSELGTLVEYLYDTAHGGDDRMSDVIDRRGHRTEYYYNVDGFLSRLVLPEQQVGKQFINGELIDGPVENFATREFRFEYEPPPVDWTGSGNKQLLTKIIAPDGSETTFEYDLDVGNNGTQPDQSKAPEDQWYRGGSTKVVDALGNARARSNDAEFVQWRLDNGYYEIYDASREFPMNPNQPVPDPAFKAQVDEIRNAHSMVYEYDEDSYITAVTDQFGLKTTYEYDDKNNVTAITDRNGWAITRSDSDYFRTLRKELGVVDAAGNGKLVGELSNGEKDLLTEGYTSSFKYDDRGNLIESKDNEGNITTFTYTSFNKIASTTAPMGHALITRNDQFYQDKRVELGYTALVENLNDDGNDNEQAILDLYTTFFEYDSPTTQNLSERRDPGGDITRFEYDGFGNVIKKYVLLDASDQDNEDKQQVTRYEYDFFGRLIKTIDPENNTFQSEWDPFGNQTKLTDGRGNDTSFTYDEDNRLIAVTDAEGNITINGYDAVGNLITVADAAGHTVTSIYDVNNNLIQTIDPSESVDPAIQALKTRNTQFVYDVLGNNTSVTDAEGRRWETKFNERSETVEVVTPEVKGEDGSTLISYVSTMRYDGVGNRISVTNNRGYTTDFVFTQNYLIREETDANGHVVRYEYDANNNNIKVIAGIQLVEAKRQVLTLGYDEEDQLERETDAEGFSTKIERDAAGNARFITTGLYLPNPGDSDFVQDKKDVEHIAVRELIYDKNNRVLREILPEVIDPETGNPIRYEIEHHYDENGNEIRTVDENGYNTKFTFDRVNQLVMVEDPNGVKTVYEYDSRYNKASVMIGVDAEVVGGEIPPGPPEPPPGPSTIVLTYDDFESGLGNYQDGNTNNGDMKLYTGGTHAHQGNNAANIQDNSGVNSSFFHANPIDVTSFDRLEVEFWYKAVDIENNENFFVEFWDGSSWQVARNFIKGQDFQNNQFNNATVTIEAADFTFSTDAKIRFRADASNNADDFYIDEIEVRGISDSAGTGGGSNNNTPTITINNVDQAQITRFIYDEFNQLVAKVDGLGNALAESDLEIYKNLRENIEGFNFSRDVSGLSEQDKNDIRALYTEHYEYDRVGNLLRITDNENRVTENEYDALDRLFKITKAANFASDTAIEFNYYDGNDNRVAFIDGNTNRTNFTYEKLDRLEDVSFNRTTFDDNDNEEIKTITTRNEYDAFGNLKYQTQALDSTGLTKQQLTDFIADNSISLRRTYFEYDLNNRLLREVQPEQNSVGFRYDAVGNRLISVDGKGNETRHIYDALNRNIKVIDPLSFETVMEYDGVGNRISLIDARGGVSKFTFDPGNRMTKLVDAENREVIYRYDVRGNRIEQIMSPVENPNDPAQQKLQQVTIFEYDAENNLRKIISQIDETNEKITSYDFDRVYNETTVTDANGNKTITAFDALNRAMVITDALNGTVSFTYDDANNILTKTDQLDRVTLFRYYEDNQAFEQETPDNVITRFEFDLAGNQSKVTRAYGTTEQSSDIYFYDLNDRLREHRDALQNSTKYDYDENNNQTIVTDARNNSVIYTRDSNDRVIFIEDPEGNVVEYIYDENGNRVQVVTGRKSNEMIFADPPTNSTFKQWQDLTTLEKQSFYDNVDIPLSISTDYYNANNEIAISVDAEGYATSFVYDSNGNVDSQTLHMEALSLPTDPTIFHDNLPLPINADQDQTIGFEYDKLNRMTARIDGEGFRQEYYYDEVGNRLSTRQYLDKQNTLFSETHHFYDELDREVAMVTQEGFLRETTYYAVGTKKEEIWYKDKVSIPADGSRPLVDQNNQSYRTFYEYTLVDQLEYETNVLNVKTKFEYDKRGNRTLIVEAIGTEDERKTKYTFDKADRLFEQEEAFESLNTSSIKTRFVLDANGNVETLYSAYQTAEQRQTDFEYDKNNRQIFETIAVGSSDEVTNKTDYDAHGNVTFITRAYRPNYDPNIPLLPGETAPRTTAFLYDRNNRAVTEITGYIDSNTHVGIRADYEYDGAGNRTRKTIAANTVDQRVSTFEFDKNNLLSAKVAGVDSQIINDQRIDTGGVRAEFTYDGAGNKLTTKQAVGVAGEERTTIYEYYLDNRLKKVTDPEGGETSYDAYDVFGNQTRITDANGAIQTSQFDALGRLLFTLSPSDRQGNTHIKTSNTYDERGNIKSTTQSYVTGPNSTVSDARTTHYDYDVLDRQTTVTNPEDFSTTVTYDRFGNQRFVTTGQYFVPLNDPNYNQDKKDREHIVTTEFRYDELNRQTKMILGQSETRYKYDLVGNRIEHTDALGTNSENTTKFFYDVADRLVRTEDPEGGITRMEYNSAGDKDAQFMLQSTEITGGSPVETWIEHTFEYDLNGRLIYKHQNPNAVDSEQHIITRFVYDSVGNQLEQRVGVDPNNLDSLVGISRSIKEYDLNNRVSAEIDGAGNRREYTYDSLGNRIKVNDALGNEARYYFDLANRLTHILDAEGSINEFTYDSAGNRIKEHVYATSFTGTIDDLIPPSVSSSPNNDRVSVSVFDGANKVLTRIDADGMWTDFVFDGSGNMLEEHRYGIVADTTVHPETNNITPIKVFYQYDNNNRLETFTDVDGTITTNEYDAANNKIVEIITSIDIDNPSRRTDFYYDLNNRKVKEIFDPILDRNGNVINTDGLNIVQELIYDKMGNVITKINGNGDDENFVFDINNRLSSNSNGLGDTTSYTYYRNGNQRTLTDGLGQSSGAYTEFVYYPNDLLRYEIKPEVTVFTIEGGEKLDNPTIEHIYDANGNQVQIVDANGVKTTRYFDANNRLVAELHGLATTLHDDGDQNVLREWTHNAFGEVVTETLYMEFLSDDKHDINQRPVAPAGEFRVTTRHYDKGGRVERIDYPPIEFVTLSNLNNEEPTVTVTQEQDATISEEFKFDRFGNTREQTDKVGNTTYSYFDEKGQLISQIDGEGYVLEWRYDSQGNVLEQKTYTDTVDTSTLDPIIRPNMSGAVNYSVIRKYDVASRLIEEQSPSLLIFDTDVTTDIDAVEANPSQSTERVITRYTYDGLGNQTSRTLAYGTNEAITEYNFYDAAGRQIALLDAKRIVNLYDYDANGNRTQIKRFFTPLPITEDLSQIKSATELLFLMQSYSDENDQAVQLDYDALNRLTMQTEFMNPDNNNDNLVQTFRYDAMDQRTEAVGALAQNEFLTSAPVTQFAYNARGQVSKVVNTDGSAKFSEYDAAGNLVLAYTGASTPPSPAVLSSVSLTSEGLFFDWEPNPNEISAVQSYVVYGTDSLPIVDDSFEGASTITKLGYQNSTGVLGNWVSVNEDLTQATISTSELTAGETVYFRIVTQNTGGGLAWTQEQSIVVPPKFSDISLSQPTPDQLAVKVVFDANASDRKLLYTGDNGVSGEVNFGAGGIAIIDGVEQPQSYKFQLQWKDATQSASNPPYITNEFPFEYRNNPVATSTNYKEVSVSQGSDTFYRIELDTTLDNAVDFRALIINWANVSGGNNSGSTSVAGNNGVYSAVLGQSGDILLEAGDYEITIRGLGDDQETLLSVQTVTVGGSGSPLDETHKYLSADIPEVTADQVVVLNGERLNANTQEGRVLFKINNLGDGDHFYTLLYGDTVNETHNTNINSNSNAQNSDVEIEVELVQSEVDRISGNLMVAWREAGTEDAFGNVTNFENVTSNSGPAPIDQSKDALFQLANPINDIINGIYDFKIFYKLSNGKEVVVDILQLDTAQGINANNTNSVEIDASEVDGLISLNATALNSDAGLFVGTLNNPGADLELALNVDTTSSSQTGSKEIGGLDIGYYTRNEYNALNIRIATNEGDGNLRRFDVDANGNVLVEKNYGQAVIVDGKLVEQDPNRFFDKFTAYDARNRKIREYSPEFDVHGDPNNPRRAVTIFEYDVLDNITLQRDAKNNTTEWVFNAVGDLVEEINARGFHKKVFYNRLGEITAERTEIGKVVTPLGGDATTGIADVFKFYDEFGRFEKERDAEGKEISFGYDLFDRQTEQTNALGHTTSMGYDHRNRLIRTSQPIDDNSNNNLITTYIYDGRDNRMKVVDANNNEFEQFWNGMNQAVGERSFQEAGQAVEVRSQYDVYGNLIATLDEEERTRSTLYGGFGRVVQTVDEGGRIIVFHYDEYGRVSMETSEDLINEDDDDNTTQTDGNTKNIQRHYNNLGLVTRIEDLATGVTTHYGYDITGLRVSENITTGIDFEGNTHNRTMTYTYDEMGQMTRWHDAETKTHLNYIWDKAGNLQMTFTDAGYDPEFENVDLEPLLNDAENFIRDLEDSSGDKIYTGERGRVLREYAVDQNIGMIDLFDGVFGTSTVTENTGGPHGGGNTTITIWEDSFLDNKNALEKLLRQLGYGNEVDAAIAQAKQDNPNFHFIEHEYTYDENHRVKRITQRGEAYREFAYYDDGSRKRETQTNNGKTIVYEYEDYDYAGRVKRVVWNDDGKEFEGRWIYDKVGNITEYAEDEVRSRDANGVVDDHKKIRRSIKELHNNYRVHITTEKSRDKEDEWVTKKTTNDLDLSGRVKQIKSEEGDSTFFFDHTYEADGREREVKVRGKDVGGVTRSVYDANDKLIYVNKGKAEKADSEERLRFVNNNDGQITFRYHDQGDNDDVDTRTEFLYANDNPVGEIGTIENGDTKVELDTGRYNLVDKIDGEFPGSTVTFYNAQAGDTLYSIAAAVYGNPSLWFVLAEANGLSPSEEIAEGTRIQIPNRIETGRLTAETHSIYKEGEIVGSTLPNLKSTAKKDNCRTFLVIVIVVVLAVVAAVATAGIGAALLPAGVSALSLTGVAIFAGVGLVVGLTANAIQQGLFIKLGLQKEFSWDAFIGAGISGALSGAAAGVGEGIKALAAARTLKGAADTLVWAKTAQVALAVGAATVKQLFNDADGDGRADGKITSWVGLATSALGAIVQTNLAELQGVDAGTEDLINAAVERQVNATQLVTNASSTLHAVKGSVEQLQNIAEFIGYITPWANLVESAARGKDITAADFVSMIGSTLSVTLSDPLTEAAGLETGGTRFADRLSSAVLRSTLNTAIAGGIAIVDTEAAGDWIANELGNEVGQFIGQTLTIDTGFQDWASRQQEQIRKDFVDSMGTPDLMAAEMAAREAAARVRVVNADLIIANRRLAQLNTGGAGPGPNPPLGPVDGVPNLPNDAAEARAIAEARTVLPGASQPAPPTTNAAGVRLEDVLLTVPSVSATATGKEKALQERRAAFVGKLNDILRTTFLRSIKEDPGFVNLDVPLKAVVHGVDAIEGVLFGIKDQALDIAKMGVKHGFPQSPFGSGLNNGSGLNPGFMMPTDFNIAMLEAFGLNEEAAVMQAAQDSVTSKIGTTSTEELVETIKFLQPVLDDGESRDYFYQFIPNYLRSLPAREREQLYLSAGIAVATVAVTAYAGVRLIASVVRSNKPLREAIQGLNVGAKALADAKKTDSPPDSRTASTPVSEKKPKRTQTFNIDPEVEKDLRKRNAKNANRAGIPENSLGDDEIPVIAELASRKDSAGLDGAFLNEADVRGEFLGQSRRQNVRPAPEALIPRKDGRFTAVEVKNRNTFNDELFRHDFKDKFENVFNSPDGNRVDRIVLAVSDGTHSPKTNFADGFGVNSQGYLTSNGKLVTIQQRKILVLQRPLPAQPPRRLRGE